MVGAAGKNRPLRRVPQLFSRQAHQTTRSHRAEGAEPFGLFQHENLFYRNVQSTQLRSESIEFVLRVAAQEYGELEPGSQGVGRLRPSLEFPLVCRVIEVQIDPHVLEAQGAQEAGFTLRERGSVGRKTDPDAGKLLRGGCAEVDLQR